MGDFSRDGIGDLLLSSASSSSLRVLIGNGDGSFRAATSFATASTPFFSEAGYFNNDGALDLVSADRSTDNIRVFLGNSNQNSATGGAISGLSVNLRTAASAKASFAGILNPQEGLAVELGEIGAVRSRLSISLRNIAATIEGSEAARSRITDVDIAEEMATYSRLLIVRQAGAALLA